MTPEFLPVAVQTIQECGGGVLFLRFTYIKFDLFSKGLEFLPGLGGVRSFRLTVKASSLKLDRQFYCDASNNRTACQVSKLDMKIQQLEDFWQILHHALWLQVRSFTIQSL